MVRPPCRLPALPSSLREPVVQRQLKFLSQGSPRFSRIWTTQSTSRARQSPCTRSDAFNLVVELRKSRVRASTPTHSRMVSEARPNPSTLMKTAFCVNTHARSPRLVVWGVLPRLHEHEDTPDEPLVYVLVDEENTSAQDTSHTVSFPSLLSLSSPTELSVFLMLPLSSFPSAWLPALRARTAACTGCWVNKDRSCR